MLSVPRLLISGVSCGVGKAMLGLGLTHELRQRGVSVSSCVLTPNLLQAIVYRRISGRYVRTLDSRLLSDSQNLISCFFAGVGADIVLVHGNRGLFDGEAPDIIAGSDAEMAKLIGAPVALVIDARGFGSSLAAVVRGFTESS
ncbi:MAG: hypothetical protein KDD42_07545, partial [Bdellovibrionales bacterium]|nr:hypothetical protein [Bdellovibrionales bacterium]